MSNSSNVLAAIPESERATSVKDLQLGVMPSQRALGVKWNLESDTFGFKVKVKEKPPSRLGILSLVSSVYDPLGFASPFVLPAKVILQDLCCRGLKWDEVVPDENLKNWQQWLRDLPRLEEFSVNRYFELSGLGDASSCELHHFSDASQVGYGAVTYLRLVNESGQIHCTFVMSKARVVPLKRITIPRLELSVATVSVRLDKMVKRELELAVDQSFFWTDSTSVLKYVTNSHTRFRTFVANRLPQIHDCSSPSQWRYVPSKLKPADDAWKGLKVYELFTNSSGKVGPPFLWQSEDKWPSYPGVEEFLSICKLTSEKSFGRVNKNYCILWYCLSEDDPEVKKDAKVGGVLSDGDAIQVDQLLERFSS